MVTWIYPRGEFDPKEIENLLLTGKAHAVEVDVMSEIHVTYASESDGRELRGKSGSMVGFKALTTMADLVEFRMNEARRSAEREWYLDTSYALLYHVQIIRTLLGQLRVANAVAETPQQPTKELSALEEAMNQYAESPWYAN